MNWTRAASEMLRALRGKRSQLAFSRRLGYRSNVACDWEAGRRCPTAEEALRACTRVGVNVTAAFTAFQPACADALHAGRQLNVSAWLEQLRGSTKVSVLCARSGHSRYAIARWLQGQAKPRLNDFLALVEAITGRASDLVARLVAIESVPALQAEHARRSAARRLAFDVPWSEAVMRVLETEAHGGGGAYRAGVIARRLGISESQERKVLQALQDAGMIEWRDDRYLDLEPLSVDTAAAAHDLNRLKAHWALVSAERAKAPRSGDWLGYNVISTSEADLERIREVLRRAFREIRAIAAASAPVEAAALLNLQLVTWADEEP